MLLRSKRGRPHRFPRVNAKPTPNAPVGTPDRDPSSAANAPPAAAAVEPVEVAGDETALPLLRGKWKWQRTDRVTTHRTCRLNPNRK